MKTWEAYYQLSGPDRAEFGRIDISISDRLYSRVHSAAVKNKRLADCPFYEELEKAAYRSVSKECDDEEMSIENIDIADPWDESRFHSLLIGKKVPDMETGRKNRKYVKIESWEPERTFYEVCVYCDEDGVITDVIIERAECLEWSGLRVSDWGEIYPEYDFLARELADRLEIE